MDMDASFTNAMIFTSDQSQSPLKQDYLWAAFVPNPAPLDVRSDPSLSTSGTSSPRFFSNQISPSDAGGPLPFQTAVANPTFHPSFVAGAQAGLTTEGRPLTTSRSYTSLSTQFTQQALPRPRSLDFGRPDAPSQPYAAVDRAFAPGSTWQAPTPSEQQRQAGLKRRWSPSLDSMQENRLETLWSAHGVEGSGHLGADIPHDSHGLFPSLAGPGDTSTSGARIPFDIWPTLVTNPLFFGHHGVFGGDASARLPFGATLGPGLGNPENNIEIDHPLEGTRDLMGCAPLTATAGKQEDVSIGAEGLGSRRSSSIEAPNGLKVANGDTSPDLGQHDHDVGDPADGDDDLEDHPVKADPEKPNKPTHNNFVNKLHTMISDPTAASFICWTELGTSFIVSSAGEFSREILGQHFKHSNFSSFVRQLNMYGFHKINRTARNQRPQADAQRWEFSHPKFLRGRTDLLEDIKRKAIEPDPNQTRQQRVELPTEVAAQLRRMSQKHTDVVNALLAERRRVQRLIGVVKSLYDALAHVTGGGNIPGISAFPMELLDSPSPPVPSSPLMDDMLAAAAPHTMTLAGNTLVPLAVHASSPTSPDRSHHRVETERASKRMRLGVELDGHACTRSPTQPDSGGGGGGGGGSGGGGGLSTRACAKRRCHTTTTTTTTTLHNHAAAMRSMQG